MLEAESGSWFSHKLKDPGEAGQPPTLMLDRETMEDRAVDDVLRDSDVAEPLIRLEKGIDMILDDENNWIQSYRNSIKHEAEHPEAPLMKLPSIKSPERERHGPVLLISDGIHPDICQFFPYTRSCSLRHDMNIDIADVLYSNGDWFLIREGLVVSFWNINLEEKWHISEVDEIIHHGYFTGKPPFDSIIILASQLPPQAGEEAITSLWLRRSGADASWQRGKVNCRYEDRGINSIILYEDMLFWLSDDGSLCCVKIIAEELHVDILKEACLSHGLNFSLVEHLNKLYIVKSGGFFPYENARIYQVIPGAPSVIFEKRLNGKDVFMVHKQGGFMLQSDPDDCKVFTGCMLPDVECAMYSHKNDTNEKIKRCELPHHLTCTSVWAILRSAKLL